MSERAEIPFATPFPWDNASMKEAQKHAIEGLRKRPFVGSGLAALRKNAFGPTSTMGDLSKNILMNLLHQHGIDRRNEEEDFETEADELYGASLSKLRREANLPDRPEEKVLELAREGRLSLFASILKVIEEGESPLTTKTLIKKSCLTTRPGDVPGSLDGKEMVLAALHFLSSNFEAKSEHLINLPLIHSIQEVADLEKKSYEKAGDWKLDDIKENVLRLEQVFLTSPTAWKWLRRETFSPRLSQEEETAFFFKGAIPASASAKKTQGGASRKRKATSTPPPTVSTSPVNESTIGSTNVVEATAVPSASPSDPIV